MEPATWENCRAEFDRSYVALLVPGTGPAAWQAFWSALRSGPFEVLVLEEFDSIPPPKSVAWIFSRQEVVGRIILAYVTSGAVTPFCYFNFEGSDGDRTRLHIDCLEMVGAEAFKSVLVVMRFLAGALGLPVLAVEERGGLQDAFLRVSPDGQAVFLPAGSRRHAEPPTTGAPGQDGASRSRGSPHASRAGGPTGSATDVAGEQVESSASPGRHPRGVPVPSHLADWLGPLDWFADDPYIEGDLVCPCGQHELELHYPGQMHHPPDLPEPIPCVVGGWFAVKAVCAACGRQAIVFDSRIHGLTVFLGAASRQGEELPPLSPWACSACGRSIHRGRVHFRLPDKERFLQYVEGDCGLERWGDGIEWFGMKIECCGCGHNVGPWAGYED
jgi:hypothetical protein